MPKLYNMFHLSKMFVYPVKGMRGIALKKAILTPRGIKNDRRFMLVDQHGKFISQREMPILTQLQPDMQGDQLHITWVPSQQTCMVTPPPPDAPTQKVHIWDSSVLARICHLHTNQWLSDHLGFTVRLVYMPHTTRRSVPPKYAGHGHTVGFADAYPFLIANEASVAELNTRLEQPITMDRFRPNLVIAGPTLLPWEEDQWRNMTIGSVAFQCVKPCARCIVITTDQITGARYKEPLKTLSTYRNFGNKVLFGQNAILFDKKQSHSTISVGDSVHFGA
jgi:uncharacterized protein